MTVQHLDLRAIIPRGRVVIDASAGTGKTFAVAGIVARLLIEHDTPIDQILVTTFTRAAARELRSRIRERLVKSVGLLERGDAGTDSADPVVAALLSDTDPAERALRIRRARTAVTDFDSASIGTIHSLCQRLLRLAGHDLELDVEPDSNARLIEEVVNDFLVREAVEGRADIDAERLAKVLEKALDNPKATPWIADPADERLARDRAVVVRCLQEIRRRKASTVTYDGLLYHAHQIYTDPAASDLRATFAQRYGVAVVDEAQDTDPLQWELLNALFPAGEPDRSLYVVGDPKQSIYSFRGADVEGYVASRDSAGTHYTLARNFRSDQPLLDALNGLFQDAEFGPGITYTPVDAPPERATSKLSDDQPVAEIIVTAPDQGDIAAEVVVRRVAAALAQKRFLAKEVAVIVGSRLEARSIETGLRQIGIPAVTSGTESVAKSAAATNLRTLLLGLDRPTHSKTARRVSLSWFGTLQQEQLVELDDDGLLETQELLRAWRDQLERVGIAGVLETLLSRDDVIARMAADGALARNVTDLGHLGEVLHDRCGRGGTAPSTALTVLTELGDMDEKAELVTRRIETDAEAVQIMTIHVAKGLEFPFVIVAKKWKDRWSESRKPVPLGRFTEGSRERALDCGFLRGTRSPAVTDEMLREYRDEQSRLLYVALTRAKHQLVLVYNADTDGTLPTTTAFGLRGAITAATDLRSALAPRLGAIATRVHFIDAQTVIEEPASALQQFGANIDPGELNPAPPPPPISAPRRRWSFTTMSSRRHRVAADERGGDDEFGAHDAAPSAPATVGALASLPAGAEFGTIIHSVFEYTDFAAPDLDAELRSYLNCFANTPSLRGRHDELAAGLAAVISTPLGTAAPLDLRLADITRAHRLDELRFDFALADEPGRVRGADIGRVLREFITPSDPLYSYARLLEAGALQAPLLGMLNGSIDLVLRHPARAGEFLIADYKSNRLGDYRQASLLESMMDHHYPLQGLLYSVALFRLLRWRLGESDPSPRIAGFAYLFIRGMTGADTARDGDGRTNGVFHWQPPPGLIAALSDLLSGVARV